MENEIVIHSETDLRSKIYPIFSVKVMINKGQNHNYFPKSKKTLKWEIKSVLCDE